MVIEIMAAGGLAAAALQIGLMARGSGAPKLPPPKKLGLPAGGLASAAAAHAALAGRPGKKSR